MSRKKKRREEGKGKKKPTLTIYANMNGNTTKTLPINYCVVIYEWNRLSKLKNFIKFVDLG